MGEKKNTDKILSNGGRGPAAEKANEYFDNNSKYGDWYLPSYYELLEMYSKRFIIGNFVYSRYWSSTESGYPDAYAIDFSVGPHLNSFDDGVSKGSYGRIRPVRRF